MRRLAFSLALLSLLTPGPRAQTAAAAPYKPSVGLSGENPAPATRITLGQSIVPLYGPWKFHIGDNPAWADPGFDDSQWETVDLTPKQGSFDPIAGMSGYVPGWTAKGHPGYSGWAWYRLRVRTDARPGEKLALAGPTDVDDAYQVFANGKLLGSFGKFPATGGRPVAYITQPRRFALPQAQGQGPGADTQVLAFRVWMEPTTLAIAPDAGGMHTAPLLGEAGVVAAQYQLAWLALVRYLASVSITAALFLMLALLAASLLLFDRSDPVYLWLAGVFLVIAVESVILCLGDWTLWISATVSRALQNVFLSPLVLSGWAMVWWVWFRLRRPAWVPKLIAGLTLLSMLSTALGEDFFPAIPHPVGVVFHSVSLGVRLLFLLLLVGIAVQGIRGQGWEGWLALPALALVGLSQFELELGLLHLRTIWFPFGVLVTLGQLAVVLLVVAISALLLRRALLSVRQQREMALDVKQAQEVQQVLIPMALPQIPGLAIESEYRPAREVGGDFFQIIPHATDVSVLIVTGDVTGHGLQAGMLVALIVGAIRATAQFNPDPLAMLQSLNQRLMGRGNAHATALALRIAADGACTLANAGHMPPYLNGKELPMPGAMPLGMIESAEFSVMHFQLAPGDTLTLLSDGVAEATSESGELFGFDRILVLLQRNLSAAQIATAAQQFGQIDDISVLRIVRSHA